MFCGVLKRSFPRIKVGPSESEKANRDQETRNRRNNKTKRSGRRRYKAAAPQIKETSWAFFNWIYCPGGRYEFSQQNFDM
jgi:hypothetical protein